MMRWLIFSTQPSKARGSSTLASAWLSQGVTTRGKDSCHHSQSNPAKHSAAHCMSVQPRLCATHACIDVPGFW